MDSPARTTRPPTHGYHIQETISSSLDEGLVPLFLFDLSNYINAQTLPAPKFVQILLHLLLTDQVYPDITPLGLLQTLVVLHQTEHLADLIPVPGHDHASWEARGKLEAVAKRRMRACKDEGVWALLWDTHARAEADANCEVKRDKVVSERGWDVLDWLVLLWKRDSDQQRSQLPGLYPPNQNRIFSSPLFLAQFPRKAADLQLDDAKAILGIMRSAYSLACDISTRRQRKLANQTLHLLTDSVLGPNPPFHPPSYVLAFISLCQSLSPDSLSNVLSDMRDHLKFINEEQYSLAHILTVYLEDLGGIRQAKLDKRRQRPRNADGVDPEDGLVYRKEYGSFPIPSSDYFVEGLLGLAPRDNISDSKARMGVVKSRLLLALQDIDPRYVTKRSFMSDDTKLQDRIGDTVDRDGLYALSILLDITPAPETAPDPKLTTKRHDSSEC